MAYEPKPVFIQRMKLLLDNKEDLNNYLKTIKTKPKKSIRVNTLKTTPEKLKQRLKKKNWKFHSIKNQPEIIIIDSDLKPGELGKTLEHTLGYYYIQETTSMMPIISLQPKPNTTLLDLCAAPGSKTTQAAALMKDKGTILANDVNLGRISILSANLEKQGTTNTIITRHEGLRLCKLLKNRMQFDKILVDAPCSGEGNIRVSQRTLLEWSESMINKMSGKQKRLASYALQLLKPGGELLYSTCTHAPEENELVIQYLLDNHNIELQQITLPIKSRPGITQWNSKKLSEKLKLAHRIYPHDENLEGFFLCKIKKLK